MNDIPARAPKADPGPQPEPIEVVSMGSHGATIKVRKPDGTEEDVDFELDGDIEEVDPPYGYEGTIYGEIDGVEYGIAVSLVDAGGGDYDMDLSYDGLVFVEGKISEMESEKDPEDMIMKEEGEEMPGSNDEGYQDFLSALSKFVGLKKEGVITEDEYSKIMDACLPIYNRLKGEDTLEEKSQSYWDMKNKVDSKKDSGVKFDRSLEDAEKHGKSIVSKRAGTGNPFGSPKAGFPSNPKPSTGYGTGKSAR
jgi:hypothetical protein